MSQRIPLVLAGIASLAIILPGCGGGGSSSPAPTAQSSIAGTWDLQSMTYGGQTVALPGRVAGEDWGYITMTVSDDGTLVVTHRSASAAPYWQPYLYMIWQAQWAQQGQAVNTHWTKIQWDYDENGTMSTDEEYPVQYVENVATVQAPGGSDSTSATTMMQALTQIATSALGSDTWAITVDLAAIGGDASGQVTLHFHRRS